MASLKDKVILITGAASGIGAVTVRSLVEEQVKNVTIFDVNEEGASLEQELNTKFGKGKVTFIKCDVTKEEDLEAGFKSIIDKFGYLDVLINSAAIYNEDEKGFKNMVAVNLIGVYSCTLKALKLMRKDEGGKGGTIINIGSIANLRPHFAFPMYGATKSGLLMAFQALSLPEFYSRTAVKFIVVCFGATDTQIIHSSNVKHFDKLLETGLRATFDQTPKQKTESAAAGLVHAIKNGDNGSTWLGWDDKPIKNITDNVSKAYDIFTEAML